MKILIALYILLLIGCGKDVKNQFAENTVSTNKDSAAVKINSSGQKDSISNSDRSTRISAVNDIKYGTADIPDNIKYNGSVVASATWRDVLGSNIVFITETKEKTEGDSRSKELYGYHYIIDDSGNELLWKINDFIKECPVDLTLKYFDRSLTITDVNKNGIGESTFLYRMSCKGDVSSDEMKLIMHEGKDKYAIRGSMNLKMNGENYEKGTMNIDASFDNAPPEFIEYAKGQWSKFNTEIIGN